MDLPAVSVRLGRADVVNEENQNIRRIFGQVAHRRQRTVSGLLHRPFGSTAGLFGREWQNLLRDDGPDKCHA